MIGYLKGVILDVGLSDNGSHYQLIVDVNSVGYEVYLPHSNSTLLNTDIKVGLDIELWIYTVVREDSFCLYGFIDKNDKTCFSDLLSVSGVGPKVALSIIANLGADSIYTAINNEDVDILASSQGLGKKGAAKIVLELKGKLITNTDSNGNNNHTTNEPHNILVNQVIDAVVSLGFKKEVVKQITNDLPPNLSVEDAVKFTLRHMNK